MTFKEFVDINLKVSLKKGEEYSFIPMKDVSPGNRYSKATRTKIYKGGGTKFRDHDIIFARITPCLENGKIAQAANLKNGLGFGSTEYFVFRGKKEISDTAYIYYLSLTDIIKKTAEKSMSGASGRQRADIESIKSIELDFPDLPTQHKIASILSAYDDLIENNARRIKILEEMAQTIYKEWFVNFRFPDYEKVKFVDSSLGKIPEGWEVKNLNEVCENFDSKRKPISSLKRKEMQGDFPYYGAAKVIDYVNDFIFDGKYLLLAEDGSVITKDAKPVLQFVSEKFWANNHTHILQGLKNVSTEFLYLFLSEYDISGHITGVAQPKINQENLNRIKVLVSSEALMQKFNEIVIKNFNLIRTFNRENQNLRKTRDLLLPKLMSGDVEV